MYPKVRWRRVPVTVPRQEQEGCALHNVKPYEDILEYYDEGTGKYKPVPVVETSTGYD